MKAYERLLNYVVIPTPSNEDNDTTPTTTSQFDLANLLVKELHDLGVDAFVNELCFVYGKIPATPGLEHQTKIGFIAHMDTVSDFCEHTITPIVTKHYDGKDLVLGSSGRTLSVQDFPHLPSLAGRTLITSDGATILGADDKAGIAEIMTMIEQLKNTNIPHGPIRIAFTPDEETGSGASHFDVKEFDSDFAYTMDGSIEGEIEFENFNACKATFEFSGFNVHPGTSKNTMINASLVAMEVNSMLPSCETPRGTKEYEGFYHLVDMKGSVSDATLHYIVRDHNYDYLDARKNTLRLIESSINEKWGDGTVTLTIVDQYRNMAEIIAGCMHLIDNAKLATMSASVTPHINAIRGGTDGAQLSFMGLPCPNLGTGGFAFHGPYEHITAEGMDSATDIIIELIKLYATH